MLRLGIVDFDSSHSAEFTQRFNHAGVDRDQHVEGARVVLGWPGTSQMSPERIPVFTPQVQACGVELVDAPEQMLGRIDAVLVLSVCGRPHLERVRPFLEAGVPAFVDKPFACSLADAEEMVRLAEAHRTMLFSSSGLRYACEVLDVQQREADYGPLHGLVCYGPAKRDEGNPGLFHYGIHAVEMLFALMGPGCESVQTAFTEDAEVVTGRWRDGRLATVRGNRRGSTAYGFTAFCEKAVVPRLVSSRYAYRNLCRAIVESIQSGRPAVPHAVTLEIVRFILASLESERRGSARVALTQLDGVIGDG
jgi:predicted dehydrogenase